METTTIFNVKERSKQERLRLDSRTFYEKSAATTLVSGSDRIGMIHYKEISTIAIIIPDSSIEGTRVGRTTSFSNINDVDSFRYGKDVKSVKNLLNDKIVPNITLGREQSITSDDYIDHSLELCFYGQNSLFKTYDYKRESFIPFEDFEGKPAFKRFIGLNDEDKSGMFPYAYNEKRNYDKFRDPDPASLDGAIEVFHVRNSPANTGFIDLQIKGARGLFGVGNWELTQHTTYGKKGSPLVSERYEIKQSSHDFFDDADESILGKPVEGFISEGLYKSSPFIEKNHYLTDEYEHLTAIQKSNLISSSSRDDSELGTRFKSRDNGLIITPFYQLTEQRSFGTDSIAFSGLLKG